MFTMLSRTCSDAELVGDRLIGRRYAEFSIRDGKICAGSFSATVNDNMLTFSKSQQTDLQWIIDHIDVPFADFFLALFKEQVKSKKQSATRPVFWVFQQILWKVVFLLEKRLVGRTAFSTLV